MSKVVDVAKDFVKDVGDVVVDVGSDFVEVVIDVGRDVLDVAIDFNKAIFDTVIYSLDIVAEPLGLGEYTQALSDINTGISYLSHAAVNGDWHAVLQLSILVGTVAITVMTFGATAPATSALLAAYGIGVTSSAILMGVYYTTLYAGLAMSIYSLYGVAISVAELGAMVARGGVASIFNQLNGIKDSMNLALVNGWINGSANLWMAGGILYDSPKAGDILFNPTGDLNTTKFLNIPNKNSNEWSKWNLGKMHDFQASTYGNLAGSDFFAVSPLAQRI